MILMTLKKTAGAIIFLLIIALIIMIYLETIGIKSLSYIMQF